MKKFIRIGAVSALLCASGVSSAALLTLSNAGFEADATNPTSWTPSLASGNVEVLQADGAVSPNEGNNFLRIIGAGDSTNAWVEVTQTITMAVGDEIKGAAAFDGHDDPADEAQVEIRDSSGGQVATPFSVSCAPNNVPFSDPACGLETDWTEWNFVASAADTYSVVYRARNTFDNLFASHAYFDAVASQTPPPPPPPPGVPEPTTLALLGLGLAGLGATRRRKKA